jgi:hypothetical protein
MEQLKKTEKSANFSTNKSFPPDRTKIVDAVKLLLGTQASHGKSWRLYMKAQKSEEKFNGGIKNGFRD